MKNNKKLKYKINSNSLIIGAIVIVLLFNALLIALNDKLPLSIDFTYDEIFKLTEETKSVVEKIDEDVEIIMLSDGTDQEAYSLIKNIMSKYTQENSKISFSEVDLYRNYVAIQPYEDRLLEAKAGIGSLIIKSGDKFEIANSSDFFTNTNLSNVERMVTGKLANLLDEYTISEITLMGGHGEESLDYAKSVFEMESYKTVSFDSITGEFPVDSNSLVVISAPQKDFGHDEIDKLDKYLDNGGNVQIYFDLTSIGGKLSNLETYLADEWGIVRNHDMVIDTGAMVSQDAFAVKLGDHEIVTPLSSGQRTVAYPLGNTLSVKDTLPVGVEIKTLLKSSSSSQKANVGADGQFDPSNTEQGEYELMLAATRTVYDLDSNEKTGKLIVSGSNGVIGWTLKDARLANEDLLLNTIGWMKENDANMSVRAKVLPSGQITVEQSQFWTWFVILVVVSPIVLLGLGIFVFVKRRYK